MNSHNIKTKLLVGASLLTAVFGMAGCSSDATIASQNISKAADMFEIDRRIVFLNGITDTYLLSIEGKCSIEDQQNQLEVTCKTGPGASVPLDEQAVRLNRVRDSVTYLTPS